MLSLVLAALFVAPSKDLARSNVDFVISLVFLSILSIAVARLLIEAVALSMLSALACKLRTSISMFCFS